MKSNMDIRLGLVIDQERCIGCEACTIACRNENQGTVGFIRVRTQDAAAKDVPVGSFPELRMIFMPLVCNHCEDPPCADACPVDAIEKRADGVVLLDQEACDGCGACVDVCPYEAISFDTNNEVAEKCNLCSHRIEKGLEPFCVVCCEGQAIHFGDVNDPDTEINEALSSGRTFRTLEELNVKPNVTYLARVRNPRSEGSKDSHGGGHG